MKKMIKLEIKLILSHLRQFIEKLPEIKRINANKNLDLLIKNNALKDIQNEKILKNILKDIQFRYIFLKISYPHVNESEICKKYLEGIDLTKNTVFKEENIKNTEKNECNSIKKIENTLG